MSDIRYFVSLDLGSETMSGYCGEAESLDGDYIPLQENASLFLESDPDYLLNENGEVSARLRNRIALEDDRQPNKLDDNHAQMDFIDSSGIKLDYDKSLFSFFYKEGQALARKIMPNPKVLFQTGASKLNPEVTAIGGGGRIQHTPEILLLHLTTQVVRNMILKSSVLHHIDPKEIHLTLTVPNVYSIIHTDKLKAFVQHNTNLGGVDILYESDAVAYYALSRCDDSDPEDLKDFKEKVQDWGDGDFIHLVTIDIGRGTSDLSFIRIEESEKSTEFILTVLGRTGRSGGGNKLSYLFVKNLNDTIERVFRENPDPIGRSLVFNFLEGQNPLGVEQALVIQELEKLVEYLKKSVDDKYNINCDIDVQKNIIKSILERIISAMEGKSRYDDLSQETKIKYKNLQKRLFSHMIFPPRLPGLWRCWFEKNIPDAIKRRIPFRLEHKNIQRLCKLKSEIEEYLEIHIADSIKRLFEMAEVWEEKDVKQNRRPRRKLFDRKYTFVLIAGQASQFRPVQKKIIDELRSFNISTANIYFLSGEMAKTACSRGAVAFQRSMHRQSNPQEIHGKYGIISAVGKKIFEPVDLNLVRKGEKLNLNFKKKGTYCLVFSPQLPGKNTNLFPDREATAVIKCYQGKEITIEFDKNSRKLLINGAEIDRLRSYGDIDRYFYSTVWPEMLKPKV